MKRLLILMILGSCMFFMSCTKDFLNRLPLDQYSNAILWTDSSDADAALNGVYNGKNSGASDNASGWADGFLANYMDCASDNAYSQFVWEGFQDFGNGLVTPSDGNADDLWSPCYVTIQKANFFLQNIGKTPMGASAKASMIAQVRFIRAYQYFMLTQLYGDAVFDTTTVSTTEANTAGRTPKATIIKFELSELTAAAANLPVSYPAAQQGHITRGAALALKMRIELYEADYADCIADAQSVMNLGIYSLYPSYANLFRISNNGNSEDILDVQYMENIQSNGTLGVMLPNSIGGWSSIDPLQALVDNYEMSNGKPITDPASGYDPKHPYDNRDPRLKQTILVPGGSYADGSIMYYDPLDAKSSDYYSGNNCSRTGYEVLKFTSYQKTDFDNIWNTGLDMMLIRYAEVLLSYAEAKIELGQIDGTVYDAINKVRERAGLPDVDQSTYNSQSTLRTLIRRERRSEFAMEGLRWFDVQRWQIGPQVMAGQVYGAPLGSVNTSDGTVTFSGGNIPVETRLFDQAKNYLWPIPQAQRNIDKNLSQNPGYSE